MFFFFGPGRHFAGHRPIYRSGGSGAKKNFWGAHQRRCGAPGTVFAF
jgi:hypothetical protein